MSPVWGTDPSDIRYCIDTWEAIAIGDLGSTDQYALGAEPTTATAWSLEGQIPSIQISYDQAFAACANTLVFSPDGTLVGRKRLASSAEWQDAADGLFGEGGRRYLYGEEFDETACATLKADGTQVYYMLQRGGSFVRCVSPFGVFDQSGNAWEWADTGMRIHISSWFEQVEAAGIEVAVDDEEALYSPMPGVASSFRIEVAGFQPNTPSQDEEGYLYVNASQVAKGLFMFKGYLKLHGYGDYNAEDNFLPVEMRPVDPEDPASPWRPHLLPREDGAPIPDKRGGAYYTGSEYEYATTGSQPIHTHSFTGTISFRCSCDPIRVEP